MLELVWELIWMLAIQSLEGSCNMVYMVKLSAQRFRNYKRNIPQRWVPIIIGWAKVLDVVLLVFIVAQIAWCLTYLWYMELIPYLAIAV